MVTIYDIDYQFNIITACSSAVIPASATLSENPITVLDFPRSLLDTTITTLMGADAKDAVLVVSETSQPVNNSFCRISSLEVYRGREQAIEISYDGFSLNDNGTINVRQDLCPCMYVYLAKAQLLCI